MNFIVRITFTKRIARPDFGKEAYTSTFHSLDFTYGKGKQFLSSPLAIEWLKSKITKEILDSYNTIYICTYRGNGGFGEYVPTTNEEHLDDLPIDINLIKRTFQYNGKSKSNTTI